MSANVLNDSDIEKRQKSVVDATQASATSTVVDDCSSQQHSDDDSDLNEEVEHDLYPGPEEQKKDPYLVEFAPDDSDNPKVRLFSRITFAP